MWSTPTGGALQCELDPALPVPSGGAWKCMNGTDASGTLQAGLGNVTWNGRTILNATWSVGDMRHS